MNPPVKPRCSSSLPLLFLALAVLALAGLACASAATPPGESSAPPPASAEQPTSASGGVAPSPTEPGQQAGPGGPAPMPAIQEARRLNLEWPPTIRAGDGDVVRLTLEMDDQGNLTPTAQVAGNEVRSGIVKIPNLYDTHTVIAEARLDLAGVNVSPEGEISEPLAPGQTVTFFWSVRPEQVGSYRGTVWLHLRFIPRDGGPESRRAISAQQIEIQSVNLLGLGGMPARILGGVGVFAGSVLGLDNILSWAWGLFRRRSAAKG